MSNNGISITESNLGKIQQYLDEDTSSNILILPNNFQNIQDLSEAVYSSSTSNLSKVLTAGGLKVELLKGPDDGGAIKELDQRGAEWFGPTIFISSLLLTDNPHALAIALSMIANYLNQLFSGESGQVHLNIALQDETKTINKTLNYRGPVEGLAELDKVAKSVLHLENGEEIKKIEEAPSQQTPKP